MIRDTPADLLTDIEEIAGVALTDFTSTTLDTLPALMTTRTQTSAACSSADLHVWSGAPGSSTGEYFGLTGAATTFVAEIDGLTVLIDIWARTDAELEDWLPIGMQFVNSIHFLE